MTQNHYNGLAMPTLKIRDGLTECPICGKPFEAVRFYPRFDTARDSNGYSTRIAYVHLVKVEMGFPNVVTCMAIPDHTPDLPTCSKCDEPCDPKDSGVGDGCIEAAVNDTIPCELCGKSEASEHDGHILCVTCIGKIQAYEARVQARIERLRESAAKLEAAGLRDLETDRKMIERTAGTPILYDHYSANRHRRYLEKAERIHQRGIEHLRRASRKADRAQAAESNRAISSDDPMAVLKVDDKLEKLEALQALMVKANKIIRECSTSNKKRKAEVNAEYHRLARTDLKAANEYSQANNIRAIPDYTVDESKAVPRLMAECDLTEDQARKLLVPDFCQRIGFPDYKLANNNAEIRRLRSRSADLKVSQSREVVETESVNGVTLLRDTENNRLRLVFSGKPNQSTINLLKSRGFRWSPSNKAWQRQLNEAAEYAAKIVLESME